MDNRKLIKIADLPTIETSERIKFCDEKDYNFKAKGFNIDSSSFIKLGLKEAVFDTGIITNSHFEDVYGKKAKFSNVDFTGTVFINCNFSKASFYNCNFRYCSFHNCLLPHNEIISCLPTESNLRSEIANRLKNNFNELGKGRIADIFYDIEIKAEQRENLDIFKCKTAYYKERYDIADRINALLKFLKSKILGLVWGNGHRMIQLLKSYILIMLIISLLVFVFQSDFLVTKTGMLDKITLKQSILMVFSESISYNYASIIPFSSLNKVIFFFIRFLGILYLGLLAASLFRKINR